MAFYFTVKFKSRIPKNRYRYDLGNSIPKGFRYTASIFKKPI